MNFQNFLGRGSPSPLPRSLPHSISGFAFDSGFDLKSRALRALGLGFTLNSLPICLIISPTREITNKIFRRSTSTSWLRHCVFLNSILQIVICRWAAWTVWAPPIFQTSRRLWHCVRHSQLIGRSLHHKKIHLFIPNSKIICTQGFHFKQKFNCRWLRLHCRTHYTMGASARIVPKEVGVMEPLHRNALARVLGSGRFRCGSIREVEVDEEVGVWLLGIFLHQFDNSSTDRS